MRCEKLFFSICFCIVLYLVYQYSSILVATSVLQNPMRFREFYSSGKQSEQNDPVLVNMETITTHPHDVSVAVMNRIKDTDIRFTSTATPTPRPRMLYTLMATSKKTQSIQLPRNMKRESWDGPNKKYPFNSTRSQNFIFKEQDESLVKHELTKISVNMDKIRRHLQETWVAYMRTATNYDTHFKSNMTVVERTHLVYTIEVFIQVCEQLDITYFMCSGSLLGAYRHHGVIPWDDDLDIAVNASDWRKLRHALALIPGFKLHTSRTSHWKFYMENIPQTNGNLPFLWPFVDIFFFAENATDIWGITSFLKTEVRVKKSDVFPLLYRPFEDIWVYVPCNTLAFLQGAMKPSTCSSLWYDHKIEKSKQATKLPCKNLHNALPFVFTTHDSEGRVSEKLKVGDRILHSMSLPAYCAGTKH